MLDGKVKIIELEIDLCQCTRAEHGGAKLISTHRDPRHGEVIARSSVFEGLFTGGGDVSAKLNRAALS